MVYQNQDGFLFNSDSHFLYDFISKLNPKGQILDIGNGCGILGLLIARDFKVKLFGIDKQAINEYSLTGHYESSINPWISFIAWVTVLLLFIALFYIDWMSIFRRIFKRTKNISEKNGLNMVFLPLITKL